MSEAVGGAVGGRGSGWRCGFRMVGVEGRASGWTRWWSRRRWLGQDSRIPITVSTAAVGLIPVPSGSAAGPSVAAGVVPDDTHPAGLGTSPAAAVTDLTAVVRPRVAASAVLTSREPAIGYIRVTIDGETMAPDTTRRRVLQATGVGTALVAGCTAPTAPDESVEDIPAGPGPASLDPAATVDVDRIAADPTDVPPPIDRNRPATVSAPSKPASTSPRSRRGSPSRT